MLKLHEELSLFQVSVQRLADIFSPDRIFVVTVQDQAEELKRQQPEIPETNFLIEPIAKGTASVIALAATALMKRDPDAIMAVLTSDHFIGDEQRFREYLLAARDVALEGYLVTLGIEPNSPSTGFGYIQRGMYLGEYHQAQAYLIERFTEKPDLSTAQHYLEHGDYYWNSGMFIWKASQILSEFNRQMPHLYHAIDKIFASPDVKSRDIMTKKVWHSLEVQTIDYGIMENAVQVTVIPTTGLNWNDVGSWDSLFEVMQADPDGNILIGNGEHIGLDTKNSLLYLEQNNRLIVTIGINELILVDTGDVILVCHKEHAQKVRQIVYYLKKQGSNYL